MYTSVSERITEASQFGKDNGLVHEVVVMGRKVGAGHGFWSELADNRNLFAVLVAIVNGESHAVHDNHKFETEKPFENGNGGRVIRHISHGVLVWNPENVELLTPGKALGRRTPLNYNVMRSLEEKPFLIPRSWWSKSIVFRGTLFRDEDGAQKHFALRVSDQGVAGAEFIYADDGRTDYYTAVFKVGL